MREGRRWSSGLSYPTPSPSPQAGQSRLPRVWCAQPQAQVTDIITWCHLSSLHWPEGLTAHREAQQALNGSRQSLPLLNTEVFLMREGDLQNRVALDTVTASQGCAVIQTECCMFMPDASANVSSLLSHLRTQVNTPSDPTPSRGGLKISGSAYALLVKTVVTGLKYHRLNLCSPRRCLHCCGICLQSCPTAPNRLPVLVKPLADRPGPTAGSGRRRERL